MKPDIDVQARACTEAQWNRIRASIVTRLQQDGESTAEILAVDVILEAMRAGRLKRLTLKVSDHAAATAAHLNGSTLA